MLQLGLEKSVGYVRDGGSGLLLSSKEKDIALMSKHAWSLFGAKAFEDNIDGVVAGGNK